MTAGGNIKSITNSSITTVVNLSREDSLVSVLMDSSYNEDVERVEAVIAQALPAIAKQTFCRCSRGYRQGAGI